MIEISSEYLIAAVGDIVATARWSWYPAADGKGAWIASTHPRRLFSPDQACRWMARYRRSLRTTMPVTLTECLDRSTRVSGSFSRWRSTRTTAATAGDRAWGGSRRPM